MVLEIRITDPSEKSITPERVIGNAIDEEDRQNNNTNRRTPLPQSPRNGASPGRNRASPSQRIGREELEAIKTNLLNTNEVTFSTVLDSDLGPPGSPGSRKGGGGNYGKNLSMSQLKVPGTAGGGGDGHGGGGGGGNRRIRLNSELSEADSILSSYHEPEKKKPPKIPDGGYGWVVVFSSFMISLIMDGVSFSFGLIYTELLTYFGESKSKTAWIGSLFIAVPLLSGPVMSNLVDRYGCRKMTMLGGTMGGLGFVLASYSQSVEQLYFTFGILAGVGLGVGYVTVVVSVAFWFDKKRTFATGIGASGTGIGTFVYAPLCRWLIDNFGWRGTTLILAGTLFNIVAMGALMRDPEWMIEESKLESRAQSIQTFSNSSVYLDEIKKLIETGISKEHVLDTLVTNVNTEANQTIPAEDPTMTKKYQSEVALPTFFSEDEQQQQHQSHRGGGGGGGNMRGSQRSLRHSVLTKETFKRSITGGSKLAQATKAVLASSETLNSYEKFSDEEEEEGDDERGQQDGISLGIRASLKTLSVVSLEDAYLSVKRQQELHVKAGGSTWSLDEEALTGSLVVPTLHGRDAVGGGSGGAGGFDGQERQRSYRGNSLDVVYENEIFNPNVDTSVTLVVPKQTKLLQRSSPRNGGLKKQQQHGLGRTHSMRYSNFYKDMRLHRNSIHYRGALLNTHRYRLKASSCPNIYRNSMTTIAKEQDEPWYGSFIDTLKSIFDFSLFFEFRFGMLSISTLLLFVWYIIPYFYIPEYVLKYKYSEQDGANLISVIGITNTIGMVGLGWLGDRPWVNVNKTYGVCLALCGASIFVMPWLISSYAAMVVLCIIFGFTFASTFSFTPIIMVRLVSLDDFTVAYGLILLVQGIGSLVGPPIAGLLYDITERWDDSFYAAGFFIFLSGICAWVIGAPDQSVQQRLGRRRRKGK
ncbi:AGAP005394-PA-like protein [Anopheles sinensis]|uniref:AGAP005394-PA-like protein n=1 Tax=Anopheles sinensis TaxID=74873 RepID=A0A084W9W0_ANOSI|nr:AGAP005394-PA-like protein [Anopheles sinensis]